jgi:coenzyme F420 hydrogenase subunit beta
VQTLRDVIADVITSGSCSGCGACQQVCESVSMKVDESGFLRPELTSVEGARPHDIATFRKICPGLVVRRNDTGPITLPGDLGSAYAVWSAWAVDDEMRYRGSSGGALSALQQYLVSARIVSAARGVRSCRSDAARTVTAVSDSYAEILESAGSRYAPGSSLVGRNLLSTDGVVTGKPCEISATRQLSIAAGEPSPILLSFFCAGVPSQSATDGLVGRLLGEGAHAALLRYRGHGWPGSFFVRDENGRQASMSYAEAWGENLNANLQWRCKMCADGVGDAADIVAADYWESDANGWPLLEDRPGRSLLIARTERGESLVRDAAEAGFLQIFDVDLASLAAVQRYQVERRQTIAGRIVGARFAGLRVPRYVGYRLTRLAIRRPLKNARTAVGTFRRARELRRLNG